VDQRRKAALALGRRLIVSDGTLHLFGCLLCGAQWQSAAATPLSTLRRRLVIPSSIGLNHFTACFYANDTGTSRLPHRAYVNHIVQKYGLTPPVV
jgi:hypothetical protein